MFFQAPSLHILNLKLILPMKALSCNFNMVTILLFSVLIGLSCSNDADLLTDAVLSDSAINESNVVDDHFTIQPNKSIILNVLVNDGFSPGDNVRIIEISSPTYGSVEINDDNMSIIYTPQVLEEATQTEEDTETEEEVETEEEEEQEIQEEETQNEEEPLEEETQTEDNTQTEENSETTDTFTYTTEVINEDETTSTEEGTVEVVVDSSVENEDTPEEEEDTDSESTDNDTTEEEDTTTGQDGEEDSPTSEEDTNVLEEEEDQQACASPR